ncbi:MAG: autotransporter outer membrane beta-barrel domain-containing protein [Phyllobacterium sp.]
MILTTTQPVFAACTLVPGPGDDQFICDSGSSGPLSDTQGNNRLEFPAGGSGQINGDVTFGAGNDTILMNSGTITGAVDQGDGADRFIISDGTVTGNVQQGLGMDHFEMSGGTIQSLNQGTGTDTFVMSSGHIIDYFDDGDRARMTGGRIGRVNMRLEDNVFDMSGGTIDRNLVAGFGNDTIILSGGTIGGNISVSGGTDSVTVTGGSVGGNVLLSTDEDTFTWDGGGIVYGEIDLGSDNDTATLKNLTNANIGATAKLTGGAGIDSLALDNVSMANPARLEAWETINAANDTEITFDSNLVLGGADSGTGTLTVDSTSTLFGGGANATITAFTAGQLVNVTNEGSIDLTNGPASAADSFRIAGNYTGQGGTVFLNTVLGDDSSASDKLIFDGGTVSGTTGMSIVNLGGSGAATTADGIMVIEALNNANTGSGTFALNNSVAAGAFEYYLFKGGLSDGSSDNWYLRSTVVNQPAAPEPAPSPLLTPPNAGATRVQGDIVSLYRVEVPTYSVIVPAGRQAALATLGTFHERRGEQRIVDSGENFSAAWGRVFGQSTEQSWGGTVDPSMDGTLFGIQAGLDMLRSETENGHRNIAGLFFGYAAWDADIKGQAIGWNNVRAGELNLNATSIGAYWTHIGPTGWYLDGVLMGTWFGGDSTSKRGVGIDAGGTGITASIEGGYPIQLSNSWVLEPQAQLIWQHLSLDDENDAFSSVSFETDDAVTGRLGLRLQGKYDTSSGVFQPYLKANIWHGFSGTDSVLFGTDPIHTDFGSTSIELGGGVTHDFSQSFSAFATADYTFDIDGENIETLEGNVGLRFKW